ncbi:outer membrane lipoprotein-sorting protein [Pseudaquabacterium terrae]|nr:outer membrane lipoprotein-sorting protein [Aquabacterium terrae]
MTRRTLLAASLLTPLSLPVHADDALTLMQRVHDRPSGRDATVTSRMELIERGRPARVRALVSYRVERGRGEAHNLVRFLEPKDIAGTGLLSIDKADGSNEQWLYLPELDRVRRIASDRKGGRFVGSDLYYEDLRTRKPAADRHRLVGQDNVNGVQCEIVESVPVDAAETVYRKRMTWVEASLAMVHRVDYFEKDDRAPSKRWVLASRKQIQGYWTVMESRLTDLGSGHETRLSVERALYDRKLPARLFTQQALADENVEADFRP